MKPFSPYLLVATLVAGSLFLFSAFRSQTDQPATEPLAEAYRAGLQTMIRQCDSLAVLIGATDEERSREQFLRLRTTYKTWEWLIAYLQPELVSLRLNGAPLPKVDPMEEAMPNVIDPVGLQVLDESLFSEEWKDDPAAFLALLSTWQHDLRDLAAYHRSLSLSDRQVLEAERTALIRLYTLGLTGFDTPGSGHAMPDALVTMEALAIGIRPYVSRAEEIQPALAARTADAFRAAVQYLAHHQDFDNFDRLTFLRDHLDPLFAILLDLQAGLSIETWYEASPLTPKTNLRARHLFSDTLLDVRQYLGPEASHGDQDMVELGKTLFFDPILSNDLSRSCASCHDPRRAFTDGQRKSLATGLMGTVDRNSPTLINSVYSDRYFHDLRTADLESQIDHVVFEEREFNTTFPLIVQRLQGSETYQSWFGRAFPGYQRYGRPAINGATIKSALAAYVGSLRGFNSPFDLYARKESNELDPAAIRGYNLFMGKAVCGTCHFAPAFTGLVPPGYEDSESEVLGVPASPVWTNAVVDPDPGRGGSGVALDAADIYVYSFKTPTVRNAALTAPYMHNGVYDSLEQVIRFYHIGGGTGIGIDLPFQTLPFDSLSLTTQDMSDLKAFLLSLTDTVGMTAIPASLPAVEANPAWNQRPVGGDY